MAGMHDLKRRLPIHVGASNVVGLGAVQLAQSLLPAIERLGGVRIESLLLPDRGGLAGYVPRSPETGCFHYRRWLPNLLSRPIECLRMESAAGPPLLTLGDLPVRTVRRQIVVVQTPHLVDSGSHAFKYRVMRAIFRANLPYVAGIVVQTDVMRHAILASYGMDAEMVHVIPQPPPEWVADVRWRRHGRVDDGKGLSLFYPAADYPHKNHGLLTKTARLDGWTGLVDDLLLTIAPERNPAPAVPWIHCVGRLGAEAVLQQYARADALLFLSTHESYGFPLVEAMYLGLPVLCPDLAYARTLCGEGAIYFNPADPASLLAAVADLRQRLLSGWWPDWTAQLAKIPPDWPSVAQKLLGLLYPETAAS